MKRTAWVFIVSAGPLSCVTASDVLAQQQLQTPSENLVQLQEVLVTAEKRTSSVQDTPISITAVTGDDIQSRGSTDFTALAESVPGLAMKTAGPGQTEFELRGMTSSGGNSPTVGFYLDDTPMSSPASAQNGKVVIDPDLYDLNRVEVLRGPQGTLYGAGSMGGTIKVVTNPPDLHAFDASTAMTFSDTDGGGFNHVENGMMNLPFGDGTAALRIVGSLDNESGWINRIVIAAPDFPLETDNDLTRGNVLAAPVAADYRGVNSEMLSSVRAALLWKPIDRLTVTPRFFYQKITQGGLSAFDDPPGTLSDYQPFDDPEPFVDRFDLDSLNVQYHFDAADLTSETSYWTRESEIRQDASEQLQQALSAPLSSFGCPFPLPYYVNEPCGLGATTPTPLEDDPSKQLTQEVRLASPGGKRFNWLVGYFYQAFSSDFDLYIDQPGAAAIFGTANGFTGEQPNKIIQNAFFGEVSWRLTTDMTATVGLRHYAFSNEVITHASGFLSVTGSDAIYTVVNGERAQGFDPKYNLSWQARRNLLLYATVSKGFRPGGANNPVPTSPTQGSLGAQCEANLQQLYDTTAYVPGPNTFNPDSVWSYELGEKWRNSDARVTLNSSTYYSRWSSVQQFVGLPCSYNFTTNTGNADIYGGELELNAILLPGLVFSASGGYTHAQFIASSVLPGLVATNGLGIQDVPRYTSAVSLEYSHPITSALDFTARFDNTYSASRTQVTYALERLPSYTLSNLRAGIDGGNWSAMLFADNLFNKVAWQSYVYPIVVSVPTFQRVVMAPPREIGVTLAYHLGGG